MSELIYSSGLLIAALGYPYAIVASRGLWYPLHVEGYRRDFNHYMSVREGKGLVARSTGSSLVILRGREVVAEDKPIMRPYTTLLNRVKGAIFTLKRTARSFFE